VVSALRGLVVVVARIYEWGAELTAGRGAGHPPDARP
jgi:hypothetical protein